MGRQATRHCELECIDTVVARWGEQALLDCTLYVTVEPCIMCACFLRNVGVHRVVFGCANERFGGNGTVYSLHDELPPTESSTLWTPYPSVGGVCSERAVEVLKTFYAQGNPNAPEAKRSKPVISVSASKIV